MKVAVIIILLGAVVGLVAYVLLRPPPEKGLPAPQSVPAMSERIGLKTKDNVAIVGDYYPSTSLGAGAPSGPSAKGLLLLHMMPATRSSWQQFAEKMQALGWHVLAVDLRGHGESQGGPDGYKSFSDEEHQASRYDVEAGVGYLNGVLRSRFQRDSGNDELYLGGASIGANLALNYLAEHPETKAAFLLSPGLDYRGVKTESAARGLKSGQFVYYAASRDDSYSADTIQALFDATPAGVGKEIKFFAVAGHGTTILEREPPFMDELAKWLQGL